MKRTETPAMKYRNAEIAKVKNSLDRMTRAVAELKANTKNLPQWNWTGDWQSLAQMAEELCQQAERGAELSRRDRVTK